MRKITFWAYRLHRYFGIALAIPMLAWCLSGVVMMYVDYPSRAGAAQGRAGRRRSGQVREQG
jgi:hypothetical protein